eukprot:360573_1
MSFLILLHDVDCNPYSLTLHNINRSNAIVYALLLCKYPFYTHSLDRWFHLCILFPFSFIVIPPFTPHPIELNDYSYSNVFIHLDQIVSCRSSFYIIFSVN